MPLGPTFGRMTTDLRRLLWVFPIFALLLCSCDVHKKLGEMHYREGMRKFDRNDFTNSLADFTAAIAQNPGLADAYQYRGYDEMVTSNYVAALKDIDQAISMGLGSDYVYIYRGYCLEGLGDNAAALTNYTESIRLMSNNAEAYKYRGILRTTMRDYDGALADLDQAETLDPKDEDVFENRAELHLWRNEYESCITDATRAVTLNPKDDDAFAQRGLGKMHLKDYPGALADLDASIALDSHNATHFANRGFVRAIAGDTKAAEADLAQATMLDATNLDVLNTTVYLKEKSGDLAGAADTLTRLTGLYPQLPESFEHLGWAQTDLRQYGLALKSFRRALEIDPGLNYARFGIWLIRARSGEAAPAGAELRESIQSLDGDANHVWEFRLGGFLAGDGDEAALIAQATATAKRPTDVSEHQCEAYYYAGMKRLFAGDKSGAVALFEKCIATGEDNFVEYNDAKVELSELKK